MQRLGLVIVPGIIAIALFVGISTLESTNNESDEALDNASLNFNAYSEGINTILYDAAGNINYTLQAERQVHFLDDSTELEKPLIRLFQDGGSRWNIVANSGRISATESTSTGAADRIDLLGDVQVYSLDEFGNRILVSSEFLSLNPESEVLETDQPVSLVTQAIEQTSIGMIARLGADEITFLRETRGRHDPARD